MQIPLKQLGYCESADLYDIIKLNKTKREIENWNQIKKTTQYLIKRCAFSIDEACQSISQNMIIPKYWQIDPSEK